MTDRLITISYIELYICSILHGVIGVEEEYVTLFPPKFEPALFQTNQGIILHVSTSVL